MIVGEDVQRALADLVRAVDELREAVHRVFDPVPGRRGVATGIAILLVWSLAGFALGLLLASLAS